MRTVQLALLPEAGGEWRTLTVQNAPAASPRCVLIVPGSEVLAREVDVSGATLAQSRAAALAMLAPELASTAAGNICSVDAARDGKQMAFIVSRDRIDAWLETARKAGLSPDAILPDFALLQKPEAGAAHVADRGDVVVRTPTAGFACQRDLLAVLAQDLHLIEVDFEQCAIAATRSGWTASSANLLSGIRASQTTLGESRAPVWTLVAAAAALMVAAVAPWVSTIRLGGETGRIRSETAALARAALPGARQIVDPLAQLREATLPARRAEASLTSAAGLLEGLARAPSVQLSRLEITEDGAVHASLTAADLGQLQPLRDHLASLGLGSTETPGASRPNHLSIELIVTRTS